MIRHLKEKNPGRILEGFGVINGRGGAAPTNQCREVTEKISLPNIRSDFLAQYHLTRIFLLIGLTFVVVVGGYLLHSQDDQWGRSAKKRPQGDHDHHDKRRESSRGN